MLSIWTDSTSPGFPRGAFTQSYQNLPPWIWTCYLLHTRPMLCSLSYGAETDWGGGEEDGAWVTWEFAILSHHVPVLLQVVCYCRVIRCWTWAQLPISRLPYKCRICVRSNAGTNTLQVLELACLISQLTDCPRVQHSEYPKLFVLLSLHRLLMRIYTYNSIYYTIVPLQHLHWTLCSMNSSILPSKKVDGTRNTIDQHPPL